MPPTISTAPPPAAKPNKPAKQKKPKDVKPKEEPQAAQERPIVYPTVEAKVYAGEDAITADLAKQVLLNWETEKEFQLRSIAENPGTKPEQWAFADFLLVDEDGQKVNCWNNLDNRPFDLNWCRGLAQTILNGQWAGPTTVPGGTVNGSTVVISQTGKVESGQHSLVALVLAWQTWWKNKKAWPFWEDFANGPVIETIVVTGVSEDRRVMSSIDNCKPRSVSDVFYTSDLFRKLVSADRKHCSRMLAAAVDLLWKRTDTKGYKTNSEVVPFVDRHGKLIKAIDHLFVEDCAADGRKISNLKLSSGQCAALCYLMGCSTSDGDAYRNGFPPQEKGLDWSNWDKAKQFFALLGGSNEMEPVRKALLSLQGSDPTDEQNLGMGGRLPEKLAILAKAAAVFFGDNPRPITDEDVKLNYNTLDDKGAKLPDGQIKLLDAADFGGIDVPEKVKIPDPPAPAPEQITADAAEQRKERAREVLAKINAMRTGAKPAQPLSTK